MVSGLKENSTCRGTRVIRGREVRAKCRDTLNLLEAKAIVVIRHRVNKGLVTDLANDNIMPGLIRAPRVEATMAGTASSGCDFNIIDDTIGIIFRVDKDNRVCTKVIDGEEAPSGILG